MSNQDIHHSRFEWTQYARTWVNGIRNRRLFSNVNTCLIFIGYPRSGHSLVGAQLTAHPDMMISHELHLLRYLEMGYRRHQLMELIHDRDQDFINRECCNGKYKYDIPGQWQGRYDQLVIIGDKKGAGSTRLLGKKPELIERLKRVLRLPVRAIHVVRNPFDTISRIHLLSGNPLTNAIHRYFDLCHSNAKIIQAFPQDVLTVRHEQHVANPRNSLAGICQFLGVRSGVQYLNDCASVMFSAPRRTRQEVEWSPHLIGLVMKQMQPFEFLQGYRFDENPNTRMAA